MVGAEDQKLQVLRGHPPWEIRNYRRDMVTIRKKESF